jgi:hypothetical protein
MENNIQDVLLLALNDRWMYAQMMDDARPSNITEPMNWWVMRENVAGIFKDSPLYANPSKERIQELDPLTLDALRHRLDNTPFPAPRNGFERRPGYTPTGWTRGIISIDDHGFTQYQPGVELTNRVVIGNTPGWALKLLIQAEIESGKGRWLDYERSRCKAPIPQLTLGSIHKRTEQYLEYLLSQITEHWSLSKRHGIAAAEYLIDWCCWSLGHPCMTDFPDEKDYDPGEVDDFATLEAHLHKKISWDGQAHNRLVAVWNPAFFLLWDSCDWFGWLLNRVGYCRRPEFENPIGYHSVLFSDLGLGRDTEQFLFVPEITPADVLAASNYTRNLTGSQRDPLIAKAAILTGYFVMPEFVYPNPETVDPEVFLGEDDQDFWGPLIISFYQLLQLKGEYLNYFDTTRVVVDDSWDHCPIQIRESIEIETELMELGTAESKVFGPASYKDSPALPPSKPEFKVLPSQGLDSIPALEPEKPKLEFKVLKSQGLDSIPALEPEKPKLEFKVLPSQGLDSIPALEPEKPKKIVPTLKPASAPKITLEKKTSQPIELTPEQPMKRVEMLPPGED